MLLLLLLLQADEWRKFGLYFAYYLFIDVQYEPFLSHFQKLVRALLTLIGPTVSKRKVREAHNIDLVEFVSEYEVQFNLNHDHEAQYLTPSACIFDVTCMTNIVSVIYI